MNGINLALVGFMLLITPALMAMHDGVKEPDEVVTWVMDRADPWKFILGLTALVIFGLSLMLFGALWMIKP